VARYPAGTPPAALSRQAAWDAWVARDAQAAVFATHARATSSTSVASNVHGDHQLLATPRYYSSPSGMDISPVACGSPLEQTPDDIHAMLTHPQHSTITQAIGKAVEILAERRGLDYVAKTLVAELADLDALPVGEDGSEQLLQTLGAPLAEFANLRPRQRPGSAGPKAREALRLGHPRRLVPQTWSPTGPLKHEIVRNFKLLCEPSSQKLDGRSFAKLCKECRFFDRGFAAVDADLIFKKVLAGSGQRKMDVRQLEHALQLVADRKGLEPDDLIVALSESCGPGSEALTRVSVAEGTRADLARHIGIAIR